MAEVLQQIKINKKDAPYIDSLRGKIQKGCLEPLRYYMDIIQFLQEFYSIDYTTLTGFEDYNTSAVLKYIPKKLFNTMKLNITNYYDAKYVVINIDNLLNSRVSISELNQDEIEVDLYVSTESMVFENIDASQCIFVPEVYWVNAILKSNLKSPVQSWANLSDEARDNILKLLLEDNTQSMGADLLLQYSPIEYLPELFWRYKVDLYHRIPYSASKTASYLKELNKYVRYRESFKSLINTEFAIHNRLQQICSSYENFREYVPDSLFITILSKYNINFKKYILC